MNSAIFKTSKESYQVSNIMYAGPVSEIPEERRKGKATNTFKIITGLGAGYCYYTNAEAARNSRGALGAMIDSVKPRVFKHGYECIDPYTIISFSGVIKLKEAQGDMTHAVIVTLDTAEEKNRRVWLKYRSEENAKKGTQALWAVINAVNGVPEPRIAAAAESIDEAEADDLPF